MRLSVDIVGDGLQMAPMTFEIQPGNKTQAMELGRRIITAFQVCNPFVLQIVDLDAWEGEKDEEV